MCVILIEGTTKLSQTAMALKPVLLVLEPKQPNHIPISSYHLNPNRKTTQMTLQSINITRRTATTIIATTSILLAGETISQSQTAEAFEFDFRMTVPDQTFEEAMSVIQFHAQDLLQVKELFENSEPESWKEAQKALRKRSSLLKQDMYTIIQGKPGQERPQLSILYSTLFNNATRLDYAARDKDEASVREYLDNVVVALKDFLSRI